MYAGCCHYRGGLQSERIDREHARTTRRQSHRLSLSLSRSRSLSSVSVSHCPCTSLIRSDPPPRLSTIQNSRHRVCWTLLSLSVCSIIQSYTQVAQETPYITYSTYRTPPSHTALSRQTPGHAIAIQSIVSHDPYTTRPTSPSSRSATHQPAYNSIQPTSYSNLSKIPVTIRRHHLQLARTKLPPPLPPSRCH